MEYYLINPAKNYTILVMDEVDEKDQPFVAKEIMGKKPFCEQVGFFSSIDGSDVEFRMAGGEFCGNASLAAACVAGLRIGSEDEEYLQGRKSLKFNVKCSGCTEKLPVEIIRQKNGSHNCSIEMPKAKEIFKVSGLRADYTVVDLGGIMHAISYKKMSKEEAENKVKSLCQAYNADAFGIMFVDGEILSDEVSITPLVYVKNADTLYWENSCASGTCAYGYYLKEILNDRFAVCCKEPGGKITVSLNKDGKICLSENVCIQGHSHF